MKTKTWFRLSGLATLAVVAALVAGYAAVSPQPAAAASDYFIEIGCGC